MIDDFRFMIANWRLATDYCQLATDDFRLTAHWRLVILDF
jgi:hypothetical protein